VPVGHLPNDRCELAPFVQARVVPEERCTHVRIPCMEYELNRCRFHANETLAAVESRYGIGTSCHDGPWDDSGPR
jgi:hypothetical protein